MNLEHVQIIMTEDEPNELKGKDLYDIDGYLSEKVFCSTPRRLCSSTFFQSPNCFLNSPSLVPPNRFLAVLVLPAKKLAKLNLSLPLKNIAR